ncbi:hypothetical protein DFJ74DRAFT_675199 [Hyaloraphidium curvatum]|nr:hypothetical protein DFJ74DRAFT_675199 [Hyaloraphidium curvatum]
MDSVATPADHAADGSSKPAGFFLPEDLAAAFPRPLPPPGPWDRGRPSNPAPAAPCTEDALMAALEPYPTLRTLAKWHLTLFWMPSTLLVRYSVTSAVVVAFCACALVFGGDTFGARQLIGGFVLVAIYCVAIPTVWFAAQVVFVARLVPDMFPTLAAAARILLRGQIRPAVDGDNLRMYILSGYAMVPAWARCVKDGALFATGLGHVEGDSECTCAAQRCSGGLLTAAARQWAFSVTAWLILSLGPFVFMGWTPLFSLPQVWAHAWGIFLGVCFCGWRGRPGFGVCQLTHPSPVPPRRQVSQWCTWRPSHSPIRRRRICSSDWKAASAGGCYAALSLPSSTAHGTPPSPRELSRHLKIFGDCRKSRTCSSAPSCGRGGGKMSRQTPSPLSTPSSSASRSS